MKRIAFSLFLLLLSTGLTLRAETTLFFSDCRIMPDGQAEMGLYISEAGSLSAFQTDLTMPNGLTLTGVALNSRSDANTQISMTTQSNGKVRIGCFSLANVPFSGMAGRIATLTLTAKSTLPQGSYTMKTSNTLLVFPNGGRINLDNTTATIIVGSSDIAPENALFTEFPLSQAYRFRLTGTSYYMSFDSSVKAPSTVTADADASKSTFFLEPAFDSDGCFYIRSLEGAYLNFNPEGSTISTTSNPSANSAVRIMETGDRTYAFVVGTGNYRVTAMNNKSTAALNMTAAGALSNWQLELADADHQLYLSHLLTTATSSIGLTKGEANRNLTLVLHATQRAVDEDADEERLAALTDDLIAAKRAALQAWKDGDTSVAETVWGTAESMPATGYVALIEDADGEPMYLTFVDGKPMMTKSFMSLGVSADEPVAIQDMFFNPQTQCMALRLQGEGEDGAGTYLAYDASTGTVTTADRSEGEALRVWKVYTVERAMRMYLATTGSCSSDITWRFDDEKGMLLFAGKGEMDDYAEAIDVPWYGYRHLIKHVVFAGDIRKLAAHLLEGCSAIQKLSVTSSKVPSLGTDALKGIPEGVAIYAVHPETFTNFLPGCTTQLIVTLQDTYVYTGQPQEPVLVCDFPAKMVTASAMQTDAGSYTLNAYITVTVEKKIYSVREMFNYTILPAPVAVTTRDYTRKYGSANPRFSVSLVTPIEGVPMSELFKDMPTASCEATKSSPVGTYPIVVSGGELLDPNYAVEYVPSTLTVTPVRLSILADDATRGVGEPNPTFTYTLSGLVDGDDASNVFAEPPVLTCEADETSPAGKYDIIISGGIAQNYTLSYAPGILTVTIPEQIKPISDEDGSLQIFDMLGRPVMQQRNELKPGIYIINGNKVIIK